jgi:gas vesicle protein
VEIEPRQRNALIIGALVGAVLGAGTGWLLSQPKEGDADEPKKPVRAGDVLKLARNSASLLRQLDDLRHRM